MQPITMPVRSHIKMQHFKWKHFLFKHWAQKHSGEQKRWHSYVISDRGVSSWALLPPRHRAPLHLPLSGWPIQKQHTGSWWGGVCFVSIQTLLRQTGDSHAFSLPSGGNTQLLESRQRCCIDKEVYVCFLSVCRFITGLLLSRRHFHSITMSSRNLQLSFRSQWRVGVLPLWRRPVLQRCGPLRALWKLQRALLL